MLRQRVPKLFAELASARGTSVMHEILGSLGSLQPVDADARHDLLEILEER